MAYDKSFSSFKLKDNVEYISMKHYFLLFKYEEINKNLNYNIRF